MRLAVDVDYRGDGSAVAAGALFLDWATGHVDRIVTQKIPSVRPYRPGRFFERELPCILALLSGAAVEPEAIVVDGYVWLGPSHAPGLGAHLFAALNEKIPVIGVAKTRFRDTPAETEVFRGGSALPLHVTSVGIEAGIARDHIRSMHGRHRVPTVLSAVDRACRDLA